MLSGDKLARLFSDAATPGFERIILDTAPVNAVSDALHLVKFATSTCLVVRAGYTPAKASQRALAALVGARVLDAGIVLNCTAAMQYYTYGTTKAYGKPADRRHRVSQSINSTNQKETGPAKPRLFLRPEG